MTSNECYLNLHDACFNDYCECLCHVQTEELFEELDGLLNDE